MSSHTEPRGIVWVSASTCCESRFFSPSTRWATTTSTTSPAAFSFNWCPGTTTGQHHHHLQQELLGVGLGLRRRVRRGRHHRPPSALLHTVNIRGQIYRLKDKKRAGIFTVPPAMAPEPEPQVGNFKPALRRNRS